MKLGFVNGRKITTGVFVALEALLFILYVYNVEPVHVLKPVSISALIAYVAIMLIIGRAGKDAGK